MHTNFIYNFFPEGRLGCLWIFGIEQQETWLNKCLCGKMTCPLSHEW